MSVKNCIMESSIGNQRFHKLHLQIVQSLVSITQQGSIGSQNRDFLGSEVPIVCY